MLFAQFSLDSESMYNLKFCGFITEFEISKSPKYQRYRKPSMNTMLKKSQEQDGIDCTEFPRNHKEKPFVLELLNLIPEKEL